MMKTRRILLASASALLLGVGAAGAQEPVFGFNSGAVYAGASVNGSSHGSGVSVGGLIAVPVARLAGNSGQITYFQWVSVGGATNAYTVRVWQKLPSHTTCLDNVNYAGDAGAAGRTLDDAYLVAAPFTITPVAPGSTQGDAKTYVSAGAIAWNYKNADAQPSQNLYVCVVANATDTSDENTSPYVLMSGPQN